ncbi:Hypothetical protein PHPALM_5337 [Phytophthora palmivora]|uniref:M96 mating-specific protein family n=1 Tax=Phytophthora palmivora TaxID=4796 RepID=A0A2P4YHU7_9STRA|nr:Hypothetical protein PHPALM_5337 [Phytophthora palmivora]
MSLDDSFTLFTDMMDGSESDFSIIDSPASECGSVAGDAAHVEMVRNIPQQKPVKSTRKGAKKSRRLKQGPVPYTTELQRRKRSELLTLRQEVEKLNDLLVKLHQHRHDHLALPTNKEGEGGNGWRSLAVIECEGRQRAERANRELKAIMANQQKTWTAIQKLLKKRNIREGQEFLFHLKPAVERFPSRFDYSDAVLGELASGLEALRLDTGVMFPTLDAASNYTIVSHTHDKCNATNGHRIAETTTTTPLACSVQDAGDRLWRFVSADIRKCNPHSFEMNCVANDRNGLQTIDGVVIYRRYDESDRIVVVGSSLWFLPTGGLQFEDKLWTVISPSPSGLPHSSVVQTRYQLQAKITDTSVLPTDFAFAENAVMSSIGQKLRIAMQALQNVLLSEIDQDL